MKITINSENDFRFLIRKNLLTPRYFKQRYTQIKTFELKPLRKKQELTIDSYFDKHFSTNTLNISTYTSKPISVHLIDAIGWLLVSPITKSIQNKLSNILLQDVAASTSHWLESLQYTHKKKTTLGNVILSEYYSSPKDSPIESCWYQILIIKQITQSITKNLLKNHPSSFNGMYGYLFSKVECTVQDYIAGNGISSSSITIQRSMIELDQYDLYNNDGIPIGQSINKTYWTPTVTSINQDKSSWDKYTFQKYSFYDRPLLLHTTHNKFTFADLFCGIGGFRISLEREGGRCIFSSELNPKTAETYFRNYGVVPFGDICKFTSSKEAYPPPTPDKTFKPESLLPKMDVISGGFPCQPFSNAGVQKGFQDSRGQLFFQISKLAKHHKPSILFLENVTGLLSVDKKPNKKGDTIREIIAEFYNELKYSHVQVLKLSAVKFDIPQTRERLFFVVSNHKIDPPELKTEQPTLEKHLSSFKGLNDIFALSSFLCFTHWLREIRNKRKGRGFAYSPTQPTGVSHTITKRYYKDGLECCLISRDDDWTQKQEDDWSSLKRKFTSWIEELPAHQKLDANDVLTQANIKLLEMKSTPSPVRMLTPRECANIFGFPKEFYPSLSNNQAYQEFGNSVVIPVVQSIARLFFNKKNETIKHNTFVTNSIQISEFFKQSKLQGLEASKKEALIEELRVLP